MQNLRISIHALLAESDKGTTSRINVRINFYPRSPCGERLTQFWQLHPKYPISIHALLAESDRPDRGKGKPRQRISIHALLAESDAVACGCMMDAVLFLSTLSLRRATCWWVWALVAWIFLSTLSLRRATSLRRRFGSFTRNFYPRSPCGERRRGVQGGSCVKLISIHALLAESDIAAVRIGDEATLFLSTLSLRRATTPELCSVPVADYFYPRSPCGERPMQIVIIVVDTFISIHALLAESDYVS